jgi:hypothetical protein
VRSQLNARSLVDNKSQGVAELVAESVIDALRERWRAQGILNEHHATEAELVAFEARYNVVLPADLRHYFATVNGTALGQYGMDDSDLLGFWHLDQVHTFAEERMTSGDQDAGARHTFAFADHSIWCFGFGIQLSSNRIAATPIVCDVGVPLQKVAESFAEFISRYLLGDEDVIYPRPSKA